MNEEAVRVRAREMGLAVDWVDALGHPQRVRTESLRRLLEVLHDRDDRPAVPPLVTGRLNTPTTLPNLPRGDVSAAARSPLWRHARARSGADLAGRSD